MNGDDVTADTPGGEQSASETAVDRLGRAAGAELQREPSPAEVDRVVRSGRRRRNARRTVGAAVAVGVIATGAFALVRSTRPDEVRSDPSPHTDPSTTSPTVTTSPASITTGTDGTAPDASTTTTEQPATTTTEPVTGPMAGIVDRDWIRVPTIDRYVYTYELTVRFTRDGSVSGFDGCNPWSGTASFAEFKGDDATATISIDRSGQDLCASSQAAVLAGDIAYSDPGRLDVFDAAGAVEASYIALDTLTAAAEQSMTGTWADPTEVRLSLLGGGDAAVGVCESAGRWSVADGLLSVGGFGADPALTRACAGGQLSGIISALTDDLTAGDQEWQVRGDGTNLLITSSSGSNWLRPSTRPAEFDLRAGTAYGFGVLTDLAADRIVSIVSTVAGVPDFDSGWYTSATIDPGDGTEDCFGDMPLRTVAWRGLSLSFLTLGDGTERLWKIDTGRLQLFRSSMPVPTLSTDMEFAHDVGLGSTLDEFAAAGFTVRDLNDWDGDGQSEGYLDTARGLLTITVRESVVMAISATNPGFC